MPRCTVLELEPLDLDLLGVEVLLGGRRDRGLDIIVDSEGGLLGQILAGLLCGPDAPFGSLGELLSALGDGLSALEAVQDAAGAGAQADEDDDGDPDFSDGAPADDDEDDEPEPEPERKPKAKAKKRPPQLRGDS